MLNCPPVFYADGMWPIQNSMKQLHKYQVNSSTMSKDDMDVNFAPQKGWTPSPLTLPRPKKSSGTGGKVSGELPRGNRTLWPHLLNNKAPGASIAQRLIQRKGAASGGRGVISAAHEGEASIKDQQWSGEKCGAKAGGSGGGKKGSSRPIRSDKAGLG